MATSISADPWRRRRDLATRGVLLGTSSASNRPLYLSTKRLFTHLHIIGPPGVGKTRTLLGLYQQLSAHPSATVVVFNPKGAFGRMVRDWTVRHGLTRRLVTFDPGDPDRVIGYNPLRPNGLPRATQAKAVREALRAAWGQSDLSQTPQLARWLFVALAGALEHELTLVEALDLLRPGSVVRGRVLAATSDAHLRAALQYFDGLREQRQDELAASSLARLEAFVLDPAIRRIFSQQARSLDLAEVISCRRLFIVNFEQYRPLRVDDVRLLGRLLINDLIAHVFARPERERRHPVFLIIDEVQTFLTEDLATALEQGRELGLGCILAHQHTTQLELEEQDCRLAESVSNCARNKIVFGGLSFAEIQRHVDDLFLDQFDPWEVKDEITTLELDPHEERRTSVTTTRNWSTGASHTSTAGRGESEEESQAHTQSRGVTNHRGRTRGQSGTLAESTSVTEGASTGVSDGATSSDGFVVVAGEVVPVISSGEMHGQSSGTFRASARSETRSQTLSQSESEGEASSQGVAEQTGVSFGRSKSSSQAVGTSSLQGGALSRQVGPWLAYRKRRVVSSRQFLSLDEQRLRWCQRLIAQPTGHFVLKVPGHPATFLRAPFVPSPSIGTTQLERAKQRLYELPYYSTPEEVDREEEERRLALSAPLQRRRRADDDVRWFPSETGQGVRPESGRRRDGEGVPAVDGQAEGRATAAVDQGGDDARGRVPRARPQAV